MLLVFGYLYVLMKNSFLTFKKFNSIDQANELLKLFQENNIESFIENNAPKLDIYLGSNSMDQTIDLKIKQTDFVIATTVLEEYYTQFLDSIDKSHYLFSFTNDELIDVLHKPYDWGEIDILLAKKLLTERGVTNTQKTIETAKEVNLNKLAAPTKVHDLWIVFAYLASLPYILLEYFSSPNVLLKFIRYVSSYEHVAGFTGIVIGYFLFNSKKTLPNGNSINLFTQKAQLHGKIIFAIGVIGIFSSFIYLYINY
jgi:hypothetical protein